MSDAQRRRVVVFTARGCHLCEQALAVIDEARTTSSFELEIVDITGDAELEDEYRPLLPVIEIDGVRAFTYFVTVEALVERLGPDGSLPR